MPLAGTGAARIVVTALTASMHLERGVAGARPRLDGSSLARRGWLPMPSRGSPESDTLLFGFGVLLYLLSLAVSYLLVVVRSSRARRERRGAGGPGAGARSRAALAARADRSALPLQQPALDQRADDGGSAGGAADVPAARPTSCARRLALGGAGPHHAGARAGAGRAVPRDRAGALRRSAATSIVDAGDARRRASCRRCCCSRSSRTPSRTASRTCSTAARSGSRASRTPARLHDRRRESRAIPTGRSGTRHRAWAWRTCAPGSRALVRRRGAHVNAAERAGLWRVELTLPPRATEPGMS